MQDTERDSGRISVALLLAFTGSSALGLAASDAINAVSCSVGFQLMGDLPMRARVAMEQAGFPSFILMNVMYSFLQLPPTVLFVVIAMGLLIVKGRFVVPVFCGSMMGHAMRTIADFGLARAPWLLLVGIGMGLVALVFWFTRRRIGSRMNYRLLNAAGLATYILALACCVIYGVAVLNR